MSEIDREAIRARLFGSRELSPTSRVPSYAGGDDGPSPWGRTVVDGPIAAGSIGRAPLPVETRLTNLEVQFRTLQVCQEELGQEFRRMWEYLRGLAVSSGTGSTGVKF